MKPVSLLLLMVSACSPTVANGPVESPPARVEIPAAPGANNVPVESGSGDSTSRARTQCATLGAPVPVPELVGRVFDNAAVRMPGGLIMMMESAVGDDAGLDSLGVLAARRGPSLILVVSRMTALDPPAYAIVEALDLGSPCEGLLIETLTCDLDGHPDPYVLALMDEQYVCGGHGESSPVLAWSLRGRTLQPVDPLRVTCGSVSCEVDPPLRGPANPAPTSTP